MDIALNQQNRHTRQATHAGALSEADRDGGEIAPAFPMAAMAHTTHAPHGSHAGAQAAGDASSLSSTASGAASAAAASASGAASGTGGVQAGRPAGAGRRSPWKRLAARAPDHALGVVSIVGLLLFLYLATTYRLHLYVRFADVPGPIAVFHTLLEVNQSADFIKNVAISLRRIVAGFLIATVLGVFFGVVIGRYRFASRLMMPALEILRPIPAIAWVPIAVMLWPSNEGSIIFITFLGAFFPILLNTVDGVKSVDGVLIRAAQSLGASEFEMLRNVIIPGALPNIFLGLALGMGVAWVSLIAAEMISGQFGIGYQTWEAYSLVDYPQIVLGMITIGVLGLICSGVIRLIGSVLMPWLVFSRKGAK
jgi:NitT/TauT family transport system permease protein